MFNLVLQSSSDDLCFILSSKSFEKKLPLDDNDSIPYDVVYAAVILQSSFFLRSYVTHFFINSLKIDGFMLFNDLYISIISYCTILT